MNNNQPAFPRAFYYFGKVDNASSVARALSKMSPDDSGMTLRDYFAGEAMQAILSNPYTAQRLHEQKTSRLEQLEFLVESSFEVADAMLEKRDKRK